MHRSLALLALTVFLACTRETAPPPARTSARTSAPAAASTAAATPAPAPPPAPACVPAAMTLCPADEAAQDPSFAAYRARLIDAVQRKDETTLRTMISPDIRTTFGAANGIANFEANWTELAEVLRLGGTMRDGMFWAPYVYSRWPDEIDAFEHVAAIGDSVPVRQQPNATAPIVTTLHWSIVRVLPNAPDGWRHVKTNDGVEGYVAASGVRSPIAHRAGFAKVNGEWKLTAFVAGD